MSRLLLRGRYVVHDPAALPDGGMIEDGALLVEDGKVVEVASWVDLEPRAGDAERLGSGRHLVIPGLVNAHHHGRGIGALQLGVRDDYLERWMLDFWAEAPLDVYLDTLYSNLNMICSGVTSVIHSGYARVPGALEEEVHDALRAYSDTGLRVAYAVGIEDEIKFVYGDNEAFLATLPGDLASAARPLVEPLGEAAIERYFAFIDELAAETADNPLIDLLYGPSWPVWCSDRLLRRVAEEAGQSGRGVHLHVLESPLEREYGLQTYGTSTVKHLAELGLMGPHTTFAHGTWLSDADIELCAEHGVSVCHNPGSNLRLRNGIAPVGALLERGVNVGLGMDSTGMSHDDDMLQEMRLAALLHRLPKGQRFSRCPDAFDIFRMATTGGARAAATDKQSGALTPGSLADAVVIDFDAMTAPYLDAGVHPVEALVMMGRATQVESVVINGEVVLRDGVPTRVDRNEIQEKLRAFARMPPSSERQSFLTTVEALRPYVSGYYANWHANRRTDS